MRDSDAVLDEESARESQTRSRKKLIIGGILLAVCAVAAVAAVLVVKSSGSSSSSTSSSQKTSSGNTSSTSGSSDSSTTSSNSSTSSNKTYTDPTSETYSLVAFAIGDWGSTTYTKNGSCCDRRNGAYNGYDLHAEQGVNELMALEAESTTPKVVISHGDNFYWTGINGDADQTTRFTYTFEERHNAESMNTVPWVNVMGNHDYGGGSYICLDGNGNLVKCTSSSALTAGLEEKFQLQATYKSPNNDRWKMPEHYYKYTIKQGDVSMDIFNLDMNDAGVHGANEICCQCYSYADGDDDKCTTATRGGEYCCGGDTDMYDACVDKLTEWGDEALSSLQKDVAASNATWKVVNSHYSPYGHNGETKGLKWMNALKALGGIQLWIYGHTHSEKHDYANFDMHFIENGAGGGIQSESASGIPDYAKSMVSNVWTAPGYSDGGNEYGFFKLEASANWLKASFITFGDGWTLTTTDGSLTDSQIGKTKVGHCWYIPSDGSKGKTCS